MIAVVIGIVALLVGVIVSCVAAPKDVRGWGDRKTTKLSEWWDEFYSRRRIWQLVAFIGFIFLILMILISWLLRWKVFGEIKGENVASTAMTMTGGLVAISYVVLKYRERISVELSERREEEQAADRKLGEAVQLLSDEKAIIQISGVYGLVAVADEFGGAYRQRVVDILCAYVRSNKQKEYAVVEATIMGEIQKRVHVDHLRRHDPSDSKRWDHCSFDFHGAEFFEQFKFVDAKLLARLDCSRAVFHGGMKLKGVRSEEGINCSDAKFMNPVKLVSYIFQDGDLNFNGAHFLKGFSAEHISYPHSEKKQRVTFYGARFDAWHVSEIPFSYSCSPPIDTRLVSFYPKAPADYVPNNTTVPELLKHIPAGSVVYWCGVEKLEEEPS